MKVVAAVIRDLLPLYVSGEASDETRHLVEQWVSADPELAGTLREMVEAEQLLLQKPAVPDLSDSQIRSLKRARLLIRYRGVAMGVAIAYTLLPFAFVFNSGHIHWLVLDNMPQVAVGSAVLAAVFWAAYFVLSRGARGIGV